MIIAELIDKYPKLLEYNYKWRNTENPELEKDMNEVLEILGYRLKDREIAGEYNDIKGYFECEIVEV